MEPEQQLTKEHLFTPLFKVTTVSKYLALLLFVLLPILGLLLGYQQGILAGTNTNTPQIVNVPVLKFSDLKQEIEFEIVDERIKLEAKLVGNTLFYDRAFSSVKSFPVSNPHSLRYIGLGLFTDETKIYSTGDLVDVQYLDPREDVKIYTEESPRYIVNGDNVYALVSEMSFPILAPVMNVDVTTFENVGSGYAKDKTQVFYEEKIIPQADPSTFEIYQSAQENPLYLGRDKNFVFYNEKLLEGIDPGAIKVERSNTIIRDGDTVWFFSGNCHFGDYSKGELSDIDSYIPPC